MPEEISVHDNQVLSYAVNCVEQEIVLHTAYLDRDPAEFTDVVFSGVVAYHFETDNFGTILFDIKGASVESIYADYIELFTARKPYGWPAIGYESGQDLLVKLRERNIRGFLISSSYGMTGFVLATEMKRVSREARCGQNDEH